ncbi:hypothetical protein ACFPA8_15275 [Streptomyces ovatisporus]|uniref:Serine/threonine protein kinase n=2 Tax=Streptomyces ovatisporus TaxID=1128682 RepID=A0ABV9ACX2_9ACTN
MPQQQPQNRASHLPLVALACTVVLAAVLPIAAATAGPAGSGPDGETPVQVTKFSDSAAGGDERPGTGTGSAGGMRGGPAAHSAEGARLVSSCGDELTAAGGLRAQTCVLTDAEETWARTYHRNGTGSPLRGALTLTRPDGTSLRAECALPAGGGPGMCETPRERSREAGGQRTAGGTERYSATAEIGTPDGARLLLRSGSNSQAE